MAPEQRAGRADLMRPATDLFALGRTIEELVQGMTVPEGLADVLSALLDPDPLARFDLAADARAALVALGPASVRAGSGPEPRAIDSGNTWASWTATGTTQDELPTATVTEAPRRVWRRPPPPPLPESAPDEPGRGARARASLPLYALREVPLVARDRERARLWAAAKAVRETGTPRVAVLVGEGGAGKSRLAESVARALEVGGHAETIQLAWHDPPGQEDGLRGAARRVLRVWGGDERETTRERLGALLARDNGSDAQADALLAWLEGDPRADRSAGRAWLLARLAARAWRGASVLWLDDAHLAGPDDGLALAREILELAPLGQPLPVLVIATVRAEALARPEVARALAGLAAAGADRIDVARLDRDGLQTLLDESLTLAPDLADAVAARCEGNPLLARHLLLAWAQEGALVDAGGLRYTLAPGVSWQHALPADAEALFARRVAEAVARATDPTAAARTLHLLALAGPAIPRGLAEALGDPSAAPGLLRASGDRWIWDHGLLHATVRRTAAARPDVRELHRELADAWARWGATSGRPVQAEVGTHRLRSGDAEGALPLLMEAWTASSGLVFGARRDLAQIAVEAADAVGRPRERGLTRVFLASSESMHDYDVAVKAATEALELVPDVPEAQADAAYALALVRREGGRLEEAEAWARRGLEAARRSGNPRALGTLLGIMARVLIDRSRYDESAALFAEKLEIGRAAGDAMIEGDALYGLGSTARLQGRAAACREHVEAAYAAFARANAESGMRNALRHKASLAMEAGDLEEADRIFTEVVRSARERGELQELHAAVTDHADVMRLRGELDRARTALSGVIRWCEASGRSSKLSRMNLALVEVAAGDLPAAGRQLDAVGPLAPDHFLLPYALAIRAAVAAASGDEAAAVAAVEGIEPLEVRPDGDMALPLGVAATEAERRGWPVAARLRERARRAG
jgi:tetratricopeptide (TPR) repeat protein